MNSFARLSALAGCLMGIALGPVPAFAQGQNKDTMIDALCYGENPEAAKVVSEYHRAFTENQVGSILQQRQLPELLFLDAYMDLERSRARLEVGERALSSFQALDKAVQEANTLRSAERRIQEARGVIGPDPLVACDCIRNLGADLDFNVTTLKQRIRELEQTRDTQRKAACEAFKASMPRVSKQNVPEKDAKVRMTLIQLPEAAGWTIQDGFIKTPPGQVYWGEYSWDPIPDSIGPDGFEIELTVVAHADKGQGYATGIKVASPDGLMLQTGVNGSTEAPVNPKNDQTLRASTKVRVIFPANAPKGQVYTLHVAPFWALPVVYKFEVK